MDDALIQIPMELYPDVYCYDPESNGYEICSPSHSRLLTISGVDYKELFSGAA